MSIWKFSLKPDREQWIEMPEGARLLSAATQFNTPTIWAQVDTEAQKGQRRIVTCVTGGGLPNGNLPFIGTCVMDGGDFVLHVFDGNWK